MWTGVLSSVAVKERRGGRGRLEEGGHLDGRHRSTCLCADRESLLRRAVCACHGHVPGQEGRLQNAGLRGKGRATVGTWVRGLTSPSSVLAPLRPVSQSLRFRPASEEVLLSRVSGEDACRFSWGS